MLKRLRSRLEDLLSRGIVDEETYGAARKQSRSAISLFEKELDEKTLNDLLWEIELAMLENNVAEEAACKICENVKNSLIGRKVRRGDLARVVKAKIREAIEDLFSNEELDIEKIIKENKLKNRPTLVIFFGFNGTGKTTTIAKFANLLLSKGYSLVLAAADTYRAASIEQLEKHAANLGVKLIKHKYGSDPAAVIFDAMRYAESKGLDVVLADTAGRTHTNKNLLEELKKIVRVNKPDLRILVLEAVAGNDIVEQAKRFGDVGIDGVVLTKWDVDQRGGSAVSVVYVLRRPIIFLGTGQKYNDLKKFDKKEILDEIVGD